MPKNLLAAFCQQARLLILHQVLRSRLPQFEYAACDRGHLGFRDELGTRGSLEQRDEQLGFPLLPMEERW